MLDGLTPAQLLARGGGSGAGGDEWTGFGGVGEYSAANGNTLEVLTAGHRMRDGAYSPLPADTIDTREIFDCVIVGGGISGLAAGLFFQRLAGSGKTCLILENHAIFGGEAKQNEFLVDGKRLVAHQGSAIYLVPYPHSFIARFYDSIGLATPKLGYQKWAGAEPKMELGRTPYDAAGLGNGQYGFWFGAKFGQKDGMWLIDPVGKKMQGAPVGEKTRGELLRWFSGKSAEEAKFVAPKYEGDEISRGLDAISLEQHFMERYALSQETIRAFLSPVEGGGSGLGPDALSAYCDYAADLLHPWDDGSGETVEMFPGGNTTIARLMVKALIPAAMDGPATPEGVSAQCGEFFGTGCGRREGASAARGNGGGATACGQRAGKSGACFRGLRQGRESVSPESALGGDGWGKLDREAHHRGSAGGTEECVCAVLSIAVHDGERGGAQLAIPVQDGDQRVPVV